jgi:predicted dehydrogenase
MADYRVGVIGCGRISPFHGMPVKALPNASVVACCDIKRKRAREKMELFGCQSSYLDYREMLAEEKLDVVHVCTPHYLHPPMAIAAMEAGCHVVTEKPMAIAMEDAVAMVECAAKHKVRLGVIFQNRYNAGAVLIKNALEFGGLGRIRCAKAVLTWYRPPSYYAKSDWKGTWDKEGGGVIIDQAIHTLDLVRWFIDEEIDYVDTHIANREHPDIEVEDVAEGMIRFRNGVLASFWAMNYYSYDANVVIELHCDNGTASMDAEAARVHYHDGREFAAKPNPQEVFDYGGGPSYWGTSHVKQISSFYAALDSGEKPEIDGSDALKTQEMVCAMYKSGRSGKRVKLPL